MKAETTRKPSVSSFASACVYFARKHMAPPRSNPNTTLVAGGCLMIRTSRAQRSVSRELWIVYRLIVKPCETPSRSAD